MILKASLSRGKFDQYCTAFEGFRQRDRIVTITKEDVR